MSVPASTAAAAKAYLIGQLTSATSGLVSLMGAPVLITYGEPAVYMPGSMIAVGTAVTGKMDPNQMVGSGQAPWMFENYQIHNVIDVFGGGDEAQAVDEACLALYAALCTAVRDDPSLGGVCVEAFPSVWQMDSGWSAGRKGRQAVITCEIEVGAQL